MRSVVRIVMLIALTCASVAPGFSQVNSSLQTYFKVCLAKILFAPKMARFSLRHSGKSLNSTTNCVEVRASSLGRERAQATYI